MTAIPDLLLEEVARPLHTTRPITIEFPDKSTLVLDKGCRFLRSIAFFEPLFQGRWEALPSAGGSSEISDALHLTVPVERRTFLELLHVLEYGDLSLEPTPELFNELFVAADMLLVPKHLIGCLRQDRVYRPREQADLFRTVPAWWRVDTEERARRRSGISADGALVRVDPALASTLLYEPPLRTASGWLLADLKSVYVANASCVLVDDPSTALQAVLPSTVAGLLKEFHQNMVLAGGAVLGAVVKNCAEGADYDLFLYGLDTAAADDLSNSLVTRYEETHDIHESKRALTFVPKTGSGIISEGREGAVFQVILRLHRDRAQVLEGFDIAPSKALARFDEGAGNFVIEALPAWIESVRKRAFWVDSSVSGSSLVPRTFKYISKGFDAFVAGTRRDCFKPLGELSKTYQWRALFEAEARVLSRRKATMWSAKNDSPLTFAESKKIAKICGFASDYETEAELNGRLSYIARAVSTFHGLARQGRYLMKHVNPFRFCLGADSSEAPPTSTPPRAWISVNDASGFSSVAKNDVYAPRHVNMHSLYDYDKLSAATITPPQASTTAAANAGGSAAKLATRFK